MVLKKLVLAVMLLLCLQPALSLHYKEAVELGKSFIRENAGIGHNGILIKQYEIRLIAVYQNELYYRIIYELSAYGRHRAVMIDMDKDTGRIAKAYVSKREKDSLLL
ncbi:hypothetical protein GF323_02910 [Candidatus Woesearchaeota archaeon]|nr:hypothetical protein [Candidatus Woesearchaeota archaeon]